jgi:hypothetical protein
MKGERMPLKGRRALQGGLAFLALVALISPAHAQPAEDDSGLHTSDLLATQLYLIGGAFIPSARSGSVNAFDATGPGGLPTFGQSGGSSSAKVLLGARVHVPMLWYMRDEQHLGFNVFFETGLQSGLGQESFNQSFQNTSLTAGDFGTSTVREYFQIPLLVGVTLPFAERSGSPRALFDLYGGVTLDSWSQVLQGFEANAPGQQGFYEENRRFTFDPTVGLGLRVPVGSIEPGLPLFFGLNAELQFRPGSTTSAISNNFAVSYFGSVDPQANLLVLVRFGLAFGGR